MSVALGIFLKRPEAGRVKTRLAATLGADAAASLYGAFVVDVLTLARRATERHSIPAPLLFGGGGDPADYVGDLARAHDPGFDPTAWPTHVQPSGDLGARLAAAFATAAPHPLLVLGTDSPDLPAAWLDRALETLAHGADAVFGATADGGVWCIGLRDAPEGFFDGLPWSTDRTGDALRNRAVSCGFQPEEVDPWYDCDHGDDLAALADRLRRGVSSATMTERWLRAQAGDDPGPSPTSRS